MKLFFDQTGPMLRYLDGVLVINDLNPDTEIRWRIGPGELRNIGFRCIAAALVAKAYSTPK